MGREYACECCGGEYVSTWTEEEAWVEAEQWGDRLEEEGVATICDDCYQVLIGWAQIEGIVS